MRNLRQIRKNAGMTLSKLSELTGIKIQALSRYERGERGLEIEKAKTLAKALKCTIEELA